MLYCVVLRIIASEQSFNVYSVQVAVDEMIERVMQKGFIDGKGDKYYPTILRLGMSRCVCHINYF